MAHDSFTQTDRTGRGVEYHVDHLATQVLSVLAERQGRGCNGVRQFVLEYLVRTIVNAGQFDPTQVMEELRGHRLTVDTVIDDYIPLAARRLGEDWVSSEIDFASVTVGALRLQSLLGVASSEMLQGARTKSADMLAMIVIPEGEQHFLGAAVLAAQLRRLGVDVCTSFGELDSTLISRVRSEEPEMLLFTCARTAGLAHIKKTVQKLREALTLAPVIALGGALNEDPAGMKRQTGVDLVTSVAKDVVSFSMRRNKTPARR